MHAQSQNSILVIFAVPSSGSGPLFGQVGPRPRLEELRNTCNLPSWDSVLQLTVVISFTTCQLSIFLSIVYTFFRVFEASYGRWVALKNYRPSQFSAHQPRYVIHSCIFLSFLSRNQTSNAINLLLHAPDLATYRF